MSQLGGNQCKGSATHLELQVVVDVQNLAMHLLIGGAFFRPKQSVFSSDDVLEFFIDSGT